MRAPRLLLFASAIMVLAACAPDGPVEYVRVGGGGILFNYRIAEATAGIIAEPVRSLPEGGAVEASFENPASGEPIVIVKPVTEGRKRYTFTTPPLSGIEGGRAYTVTVRVTDASGTPVQVVDYTLRSEIDQALLPEKPLTVGPGYARNPETLPPTDVRP